MDNAHHIMMLPQQFLLYCCIGCCLIYGTFGQDIQETIKAEVARQVKEELENIMKGNFYNCYLFTDCLIHGAQEELNKIGLQVEEAKLLPIIVPK